MTTGLALTMSGLASALLFSGCELTSHVEASGGATPSVVVKPVSDFAHPGHEKSGEAFSGKVSWYSVKTNGGTKTASGERLSDSADTAAHRTLPFGTLIEVTNLSNERSAVLKITDRGPFSHGRVLDVSIGAAKKLDFVGRGVTHCQVEVLRPVKEE